MGFEIDLLPVGSEKKSGDCIVIRCGDLYKGGYAQDLIVIDGGYKDSWASTIKPHLLKYSNCNIDGRIHINLAVLSHTDQDHVGGLVEMAKDKDVVIDNIMMHRPWYELTPSWFKDGRITKDSLKGKLGDVFEKAKELDDICKSNHVKECSFDPGTYTLDRDIKISILGPDADFYKTCIASCEKTPDADDSVDELSQAQSNNGALFLEKYNPGNIKWDNTENTSPVNESSIILLVEYDGIKVLLTGDAGKEALRRAIKFAADNYITLNDCDIIKMPHHGSRKNVDPKIMDSFVGSKKIYYSCASDDLGHHPSMRLINMLMEKGFKRQLGTAGATLHWCKDAPDRGWNKAGTYEVNLEIEK